MQIMTDEQIKAGKSPRGGWTRKTLARWPEPRSGGRAVGPRYKAPALYGDETALALCRYATSGDTINLTWRDHVLIADEPAGVVVGSVNRRRAETVFLDLLERVEAEDRPVSDNTHAGNYAPRLFADRPEREDFNKADFKRAMEALFSQSRIKIEEYGRSGDRRRRIVIVQPQTHGGNDES